VLDEIMATPDKGIPDKIMSDAKCIAVIPSMVKIAVGFGGSHGKVSPHAAWTTASGAASPRSPLLAAVGAFNWVGRQSISS
jgi:lipid-binding SYLF domain-containing protein